MQTKIYRITGSLFQDQVMTDTALEALQFNIRRGMLGPTYEVLEVPLSSIKYGEGILHYYEEYKDFETISKSLVERWEANLPYVEAPCSVVPINVKKSSRREELKSLGTVIPFTKYDGG